MVDIARDIDEHVQPAEFLGDGVGQRVDIRGREYVESEAFLCLQPLELAIVGIGVRVSIVPATQLVTKYLGARTYQMALANLDNGPDPDQFSFWHSSERAYPLNFSDLPRQSFIDKDLEDGRAAVTLADRTSAYAELQNLLVDAAPALFLYSPHYQYAVNRRVGGVHLNPVIDAVDRFQYATDWFAASG